MNVRTNEHREFRGSWRQIKETRQEQVSRKKRNQDLVAPALCYLPLSAVRLATHFVAPASCYIPIEVVSDRVREHPHEERVSSGVVFWTGSERNAVVVIVWQSEKIQKLLEGGRRPTKGHSGSKKERTSQNTPKLEEIMRTERWISTVDKERWILLFNSTILQGDCHFRQEFLNSEPRIKSDRIQYSLRGREN